MRLDPRKSHRSKVLLGLAVVILAGGVLGAYTVTTVGATVEDQQTTALAGEANAVGDTTEMLLLGLRRSAVTMADQTTRIRKASALSSQANAELVDAYASRAESEEVSDVYLLDGESGRVTVSSDSVPTGTNSSRIGLDPPSDVGVGETVVSFRRAGTGGGSWVVYSGTESGDVVAQVTPYTFIHNEIEGSLDTSRVRIVNSDGVVVYDSETPSVLGEQHTGSDSVRSPAVAAALDGESGTTRLAAGESPIDTVAVVGYDDAVGETDWVVVSYAEPSALFAAVSLVERNLYVLLGGISVLLIGFGMVVERPALRRLDRMRETVETLADGQLDTSVETKRRDEFGDLARGLEEMRVELRTRIDEAERAEADARAAREEAEALSDHLEEKAEQYREAIDALADGDFTVRVDPESRHDGMEAIGETLNEVTATLESTIADVQRFADEVADSMATLSTSAEEIEAASGEVAETVQSISAGTERQRDQLRSVVEETNELSATVEEIAATSSEVADEAATATAVSREGRNAAENAADALAEIEDATAAAVDEVEQLVDRVEQIEAFADVIGDVAEQTDMLALNANIEAARTDTDADGFAVVADEIKSLATEAGERAEDIESLVDEVSDQTNATADRMRDANDRLRASSETVQSAIDALIEIGETVETTDQGIQEINRTTDEQAATTEEVAATVEEVEEIAAENAGEASEAAAATEEQTATVAEVARTAERVADEAETLRDAASQFTVSSSDDTPTPDAGATDTSATGTPAADGGSQPTE